MKFSIFYSINSTINKISIEDLGMKPKLLSVKTAKLKSFFSIFNLFVSSCKINCLFVPKASDYN
jgi:hypothetical protein